MDNPDVYKRQGMINLFMLLADVSMDYIMAETSLRIVFVVSLNILLLGVIFLISVSYTHLDVYKRQHILLPNGLALFHVTAE